MANHPRLGEQITRLLRTLAAVKDWNMTTTMAYVAEQIHYSRDMLYHWRQGNGCPSPEVAEMLTKIGKEEANLDRAWGESFLSATHHADRVTLLDMFWGSKEHRKIPCNLPPPENTTFIGRQKEIADLLDLLTSQYAAHLISVDGIGGVGKTALILEVAYRCLRASTNEVPSSKVPLFDAIIFVSAKQQYLTPGGLLPGSEAQRTLRDLFREVAQTLNRFEITQATSQDQPLKVRDALARQKTMLIVDNLETMEEKQEIVAFLYRLPPQVKVVITTRERALFSPIRLAELEEQEALNLVEKEAQEKKVVLDKEQALTLYRRIGGIPAALIYSIGQIASGYSVKTVLDRVLKANGDVARFCFEGSVAPLRGHVAHQLLMAMAMFPKQPVREAIAHSAGLIDDPISVEEGLVQLQQFSLVSRQNGRYRMLPLTREYALAELAAYPEFEREAHKRWVEWYIHFTEEYGGDEWAEWHIKYDRLEEEWENLLAVFHWCAEHERYHEMQAFWQEERIGEFNNIYGHWDDRVSWLSWLIQAAERRGDWATGIQAMAVIGFTLTLMGRLKEADSQLLRAWSLHEEASFRIQAALTRNIAVLRIYQKRYADALSWLDLSDVLTKKFDEPTSTRYWINNRYYLGRIYYEQQNYSQAESYLREVVDGGQAIGWQRAVIFAQYCRADIAIMQGRLEDADHMLQMGLAEAQRNKDKRCTAFYKRSHANFYLKKEDKIEAKRWGEDALDSFERLGMQSEVEEMLILLQQSQG